jgi:hypothetical protein
MPTWASVAIGVVFVVLPLFAGRRLLAGAG